MHTVTGALVALTVAAATAVAAPPVEGPAGRVPPRPALVDDATDAPPGELTVEPATVWLDAGPGRSVQPELLVTSGVDRPVSLEVEIRPVTVDEDGAPVVGTGHAGLPSAATWVEVVEEDLHLDPGEQATLWPTVTVPAGTSPATTAVAAVTLTETDAADPATITSFLAVSAGDRPADAAAAVDLTAGTRTVTTEVEVSAGAATAVTGTVTLVGWWGGAAGTVVVPTTLVLPPATRRLEVTWTTPPVPGPYRAEVDLRAVGGRRLTAAADVWLVDPVTVTVVTTLAVLVLALLLVRRSRRRTEPLDPHA